jgi:hypothetical protein
MASGRRFVMNRSDTSARQQGSGLPRGNPMNIRTVRHALPRFNALSLAVLSVLAGASAADAADWEVQPRLEAGYQWDDNYRLSLPGSEIEVSGAMADAQLEIKALGPLVEFTFTPRVRATYFPNDRDENSEDYFGRVELLQRGQTMEGTVRLDYAKEDVVSSEQPGTDIDSGLGEPGVGDSGSIFARNRRQLISLRPSLSHELTQRHHMRYELAYTDIDYSTQTDPVTSPVAPQVGYTDAAAAVGWQFDFSQRSALTTRLRASRYEIDVGEQRSDGQGVEFELASDATETLRTFVRAGAQRTDLTLASGVEDEVTSWLAGAGLEWNAGLSQVFLDATRAVIPTSAGLVVERDQLRLRLDRAVSARFGVFFGARGIRDEALDDLSAFGGRKYATADLGLRWRMQQQLSLVASVDYTWQEFGAIDEDADSSGAMLTLIYEPRRRD